MNELIEFVSSLRTEEKRIIRSLLSNFSPAGKRTNRELQLFNRITRGNFKRFRENDNTFRKAKSRLFLGIFEALSLDKYLERSVNISETDLVTIRLKKKMVQYRVLHRLRGRTNPKLLLRVLDDVIRIARKYEVYDVLSEALSFKKNITITRKGGSVYAKMNEQIRLSVRWYGFLLDSNDRYLKLVSDHEFISSLSAEERVAEYRSAIKCIQGYYLESRSARIGYFLKRIELAFYQICNDFQTANDCCLDLISMVRKNPVIFRPERIGIAYDYICRNEMMQGEYEKAMNTAVAAQKHYPKTGINFLLSCEQEFRACFMAGHYSESEKLLEKLIKSREADLGELRRDKFNYYQACICFRLGKYRQALVSLDRTIELSKDKGRWDIAVRILRMLCFIELNETDLASGMVEALRKCLHRPNALKKFSIRDKTIYECLSHLEKSNFMSLLPGHRFPDTYVRLCSGEEKYKWDPLSLELIPFHIWLKDRFPGKINTQNKNLSLHPVG
ncbi:MAG TPA: hypothetical protein VI461_05040 [Chitinophagaceae bacterium]|nr:hypothetical protein [Chitinophagaceae bacterium]